MTVAAPAHLLTHGRGRDHIIDVLIKERAPKLAASPAWPLVQPLLYAILDYRKAVRMADAIAALPGAEALDHVRRELRLRVTTAGLERLPRQGRMIAVCNHPTGIADGIAVYEALKGARPDICFYANADAHRVSPRFGEVLIPVEWVEAKRTRERTRQTLVMTRQAMEAERCLVVFPAGRLARRQADGRLADPPWQATAITLARKYDAPVVPLRLSGPWSHLFHLFNRFSGELRDITLFHEFLNKRGRAFSLIVGPPIAPQALDGEPAEVTARLKAHVEHALAAEPDRAFA